MGTVVLRPNATSLDNEWDASTGTLHGVLSDDSDVTYAESNSSGPEYLNLNLTTSTTPFANGSQVRSVTPRARIANATPGSTKLIKLALQYGSKTTTYTTFQPSATITEVTGAAAVKAPDGAAWNQTRLDNLILKTRSDGSTTNRMYEAYVDVEYNERPTVAVDAVPTDTSNPAVTWVYADPENDLQERFRVKIYSAAQYGAGGFSPDTSTATYDSGEVFSFEATHTVTTGLTNGTTYRAYVKVADSGSSGRYSDWDYEAFTIAITPPPAPTVVATADNTNARMSLAVTQGGASPATTYFEVQRSEDGGTTWEYIRDGAEVTNTGGVSGNTVYDYEMHRGAAVSYRARAVLISGANVLTSPYSSTSSATVAATGFWLKSYTDPTLNMRIWSTTKKLPLESAQDKGTFKGLARSTYQVKSGQIHDFTGTLEAWFEQDSYYNSFSTLRSEDKVLLQTPYGDSGNFALQMWVSFGEVLSVVMGMPGNPKQRRDIAIPFLTVEAP